MESKFFYSFLAPFDFHKVHFFQGIRMENQGRNNTFAIFRVATKSMEKHLIYGHIYVGIAGKDHSFAIGYFAGKDSPDLMNYKDIEELTLERKGSCVQNATKSSCEAIIYPNTSKRIKKARE